MSQSEDAFFIELISDVKQNKRDQSWQAKCQIQNQTTQEWIYITDINYRSLIEHLQDLINRVSHDKKLKNRATKALTWTYKNENMFEDQQVINDYTDSYQEFLKDFDYQNSDDDFFEEEICYNGDFAYGDLNILNDNTIIVYKYKLKQGKEIIEIQQSELMQEIKEVKNKKYLIELSQKMEQMYKKNFELITNLKNILKQFLLVL